MVQKFRELLQIFFTQNIEGESNKKIYLRTESIFQSHWKCPYTSNKAHTWKTCYLKKTFYKLSKRTFTVIKLHHVKEMLILETWKLTNAKLDHEKFTETWRIFSISRFTGVPQKSRSENFRKIHKKKSLPACSLQLCLKGDAGSGVFLGLLRT